MPEYIKWLEEYVEMLKATTALLASTIDKAPYNTQYQEIADRVNKISRIEEFLKAQDTPSPAATSYAEVIRRCLDFAETAQRERDALRGR
jgi:hypothetical protein